MLGYERHSTSSERVTVEIKSQPIDLGDISNQGERSEDQTSREEKVAQTARGVLSMSAKPLHKCGICNASFHKLEALQVRLLSH